MADISFTQLEAGERIVFGPVTSTSTVNVGGGPGQGSLTVARGHTVGATTRRVIVQDLQSPDKTLVIPNADVQRVHVKRQLQQGQPALTLVRVESASGQMAQLNIQGLPGQAESTLKQTWPNAEIVESKGAGSKLLAIVAIVIGAGLCLLCGAPRIMSLVSKLLAR